MDFLPLSVQSSVLPHRAARVDAGWRTRRGIRRSDASVSDDESPLLAEHDSPERMGLLWWHHGAAAGSGDRGLAISAPDGAGASFPEALTPDDERAFGDWLAAREREKSMNPRPQGPARRQGTHAALASHGFFLNGLTSTDRHGRIRALALQPTFESFDLALRYPEEKKNLGKELSDPPVTNVLCP